MKRISHVLIILALLIAKVSISQSDTLYAADLHPGEYKYYKSKDGTLYKVGDALKIGSKCSHGKYPYYLYVWEVGSKGGMVRSYADSQSIIKSIKCEKIQGYGLLVFFRGTGIYQDIDFMMRAEKALHYKEIYKVDYARF
jgi:hypothetical protein